MARFKRVQSYKVKQVIFLLLLVFLAAAIYVLLTVRAELSVMAVMGILAVILVALVLQYDYLLTLKEYERAVVFRFGRVVRVGGPGWAFVIPLIESFNLVDLRTQTVDIPSQDVITKDNVVVKVDAVIYLFVKPDRQSIVNSVIEIEDYKKASDLFVEAAIRDAAGGLTLSELISNIGELNVRVQRELEKIAQTWGVGIDAVQITNVTIPKELEDALTKQKAAEQQRLIRTELAEAHRAEIEAVRQAAENLSDKALAYYYIRALEKLGEGRSTKFIFPMELTRLADSISRRADNPRAIESLLRQYAPMLERVTGVPAEFNAELPGGTKASAFHEGADALAKKKIIRRP